MGYFEVAIVLNSLNLDMLKDVYPVDIYEDEKLGDKKSLTVRFFIQSMEKTLEDADIESVMSEIMTALENECAAELR
jgi:phenylalanyl-tRNA synthetase beta chain